MDTRLFELITDDDDEDAVEAYLADREEPDLEGPNEEGLTPLYWACGKKAYRCAGKLLEAGASIGPDFLNHPAYWNLMNDGDMPLSAACYFAAPGLVRGLLQAGAAFDTKGREGLPIHVASGRGWTDIVLLMLDKGAGLEQPDDNGATPLMRAALKGQLKTIAALRARGADVQAKNFAGESIADLAKFRRAEVLKACGIELAEVDRTPEAIAATSAYVDRRVSAEQGALFSQAPATFWFRFAPPAELKSEIKDEFEDYVQGWRWKEVVPVARVSHSDDIDRPVAWLFLDYRKGAPRVLVTTSDTWHDPKFVDSLDELQLRVE